MKKFIFNFVNEYKVILTTKKTHVIDNNKAITETVKLIALMGFVAILTGLITNTISNLSYVINILNTIILGSFIIYKVLLEKHIQSKYNIQYSITYSVLIDVIKASILVIGLSLMIQLIYLFSISSIITLIIYSAILLMLIIFYRRLSSRISKYYKTSSSTRILLLALVLSLLFGLVSHINPINNLMANFSVTYFFIAAIYLFILKTDIKNRLVNKKIYSVFSIIVLLVLYSVLGEQTETKDFMKQEFFDLVELTFDYNNKIQSEGYRKIVVNDDYIVFRYDDSIEFYDHDFSLVNSLSLDDFESESLKNIYDINNQIYFLDVVEYGGECDLYVVNDLFELELQDSFSECNMTVYPFDDNYIISAYRSSVAYEMDLYINIEENGYIFEMNDDFVFFRKDNVFYISESRYNNSHSTSISFYYDDGVFLYRDNYSGTYICEIDDFINDNFSSCLAIKTDMAIIGLTVTENLYIISYRDYAYPNDKYYYQYIDTYLDHEGNELYSMKRNGFVEAYQVDSDENYVYFTDIESKPVMIVEDDLPIEFDILSVISIALISYLILPSLLLEGGKKYD